MGVVSFRLPDDVERRLRARGVKPGALARELVEREAGALQAEDDLAWLARHAVKGRGSSVEMTREIRRMFDDRR